MKRTFIQLAHFSIYLDDNEVASFIERLEQVILSNPQSGELIPGSGGVRKLRIGDSSKGARGGYRILFLDLESYGKTYFILAYKKSKSENITSEELKAIKNSVDKIKEAERVRYEKIKSPKKSR